MHFYLQIPIEERQPDLHCDPILFVTRETESRAGYKDQIAGCILPTTPRISPVPAFPTGLTFILLIFSMADIFPLHF